jgi:predicted dehydrogenase
VRDLLVDRPDARARHVIQAIGSSSAAKGEEFARRNGVPSQASIYGSYEGVYSDPLVDIVYIATPHALHKQNCLDAIRHNKHVLCEKPFTINAKEAKEVFAAARAKGVFIMEGDIPSPTRSNLRCLSI